MITTQLAQKNPGEWFIFSEFFPEPIPVPSWLVEATDDHEMLLRALCRIYGLGRNLGKEEGRTEIKTQLKELLT